MKRTHTYTYTFTSRVSIDESAFSASSSPSSSPSVSYGATAYELFTPKMPYSLNYPPLLLGPANCPVTPNSSESRVKLKQWPPPLSSLEWPRRAKNQ